MSAKRGVNKALKLHLVNRLQADKLELRRMPQCAEIRRRQQPPPRTQNSQTQRCTRYCPLLLAGAARRLLAQLSQPQHRAPEPVSGARRLERRLSTGTASIKYSCRQPHYI